MKRLVSIIIIISVISFTLIGCKLGRSQNNSDLSLSVSPVASVPTKISAEDALIMMKDSEDVIILDVRTKAEFDEGHIAGAILLPDNEVKEKSLSIIEDKDTTILIYCRSGRRSALAAKVLSDLGYTSVYDFGGIIDWPYDITID